MSALDLLHDRVGRFSNVARPLAIAWLLVARSAERELVGKELVVDRRIFPAREVRALRVAGVLLARLDRFDVVVRAREQGAERDPLHFFAKTNSPPSLTSTFTIDPVA